MNPGIGYSRAALSDRVAGARGIEGVLTAPVGFVGVDRDLRIVTLCAGNVARSVMLATMLESLGPESGHPLEVRSAGTHAVEGSSISARTRDALRSIDELAPPALNGHRSHQLELADVEWADLVLSAEADQVHFVRRAYPAFALSCCSLGQFVRQAPLDEPWSTQVAVVSANDPDPAFDVADPAGGDQSVYDACARHLFELAQVFLTVLSLD